MWNCPACGSEFRNTNQWHSCGQYTVDQFLAGRPEAGVAVYHQLERALLALPDVDVRPVKTRVLFRGPVAFASVEKVSKHWVELTFGLRRAADHPLLRRVFREPGDAVGHTVRVADADDIASVLPLLQEARDTVGAGRS